MPAAALNYEFNLCPAKGDSVEIMPGIIWLRQALPFSLDHINVWLLHDNEQFSIVDTGIQSKRSKQTWLATIERHANGMSPDKVIATHLHPDHVGLAGWLCDELDVPLWMTSNEYLLCRILCADTGHPAPPEAISFYHAAGLEERSLQAYRKSFGQFGRVVSPLPQNYVRIKQDDVLTIGRYHWNVLIGNGHSPEHVCLFSNELNTLISGDQILPKISSIVAVWPTEPDANPLHDWLTSCQRLKRTLPEDVLILPSHGKPFRGAHRRLQELIDHHHEKLELLIKFCVHPRRAIDVFEILFHSKIDQGNLVMAVGESIAHFNYLMALGKLERQTDANGVHWYSTIN